jgi:hypothetical protein
MCFRNIFTVSTGILIKMNHIPVPYCKVRRLAKTKALAQKCVSFFKPQKAFVLFFSDTSLCVGFVPNIFFLCRLIAEVGQNKVGYPKVDM